MSHDAALRAMCRLDDALEACDGDFDWNSYVRGHRDDMALILDLAGSDYSREAGMALSQAIIIMYKLERQKKGRDWDKGEMEDKVRGLEEAAGCRFDWMRDNIQE